MTSNSSIECGKIIDRHDHQRIEKLELYNREIEELNVKIKALSEKLNKIKSLMNWRKIEEAECLLDICRFDLDGFPVSTDKGCIKQRAYRIKLYVLGRMLSCIKDFILTGDFDDQGTKIIVENEVDPFVQKAIKNICFFKKADRILSLINSSEANLQPDRATDMILECEQLLSVLKSVGTKKSEKIIFLVSFWHKIICISSKIEFWSY